MPSWPKALWTCTRRAATVRYLRDATGLAERILADFGDRAGGFFDTAQDHEALIVRHKDGADGAVPSANAVAASVLARLSCHLDRADFREAAVGAIQAYGRPIGQHPRAFCRSLAVVDFLLEGPVEVALVGAPGAVGFEALRGALARRFLPNRIIAHHDPAGTPTPDLPLLRGKSLVDGKAALYICRNFACQTPVTDPANLAPALDARTGAAPDQARAGIAARLAGRATAERTAARAARFVAAGLAQGYGPLGSTGLTVSRLGFGCYRVDDETPDHRAALIQALLDGCNLIDTSTNYMDGESERLVGSVLAELSRDGRVAREEVVVVSKIGYVQGQNLALAKEREAAGTPFPEMVKYMDGCWHCIHPEFLQDQLARSLERLQLESLDVCLLHNPEYFFSDAKHRRTGRTDALRDEFYRRLRDAFAFFEDPGGRGADRLVRCLLQHGGEPTGRSGSHLALPDAGGRRGGGRAGSPFPGRAGAPEPLRIRPGPPAEHRPGGEPHALGVGGRGGDRSAHEPPPQRLRRRRR